jgi:monoamine oxidase
MGRSPGRRGPRRCARNWTPIRPWRSSPPGTTTLGRLESYTADTLTAAPGDPDILAAPVGRIHFAGEHTAGQWAGLMEGALRSGQRVASEVLARQHYAR